MLEIQNEKNLLNQIASVLRTLSSVFLSLIGTSAKRLLQDHRKVPRGDCLDSNASLLC